MWQSCACSEGITVHSQEAGSVWWQCGFASFHWRPAVDPQCDSGSVWRRNKLLSQLPSAAQCWASGAACYATLAGPFNFLPPTGSLLVHLSHHPMGSWLAGTEPLPQGPAANGEWAKISVQGYWEKWQNSRLAIILRHFENSFPDWSQKPLTFIQAVSYSVNRS